VKYDKLHLSPHTTIETYRDHNGRAYVAYSSGASVFLRDTQDLRRFLKIPKSIPMRESLESWLASLADMDAQKETPKAAEVNLQQTWGVVLITEPEAHADEGEDPTANTRMVV
jgi:hypothetical protein